jgi:hypothetical protein
MNAKSTRTLGIVGVALLAGLSPAAASAHTGTDGGRATQAPSALLARSEALNQQLGLGVAGNVDLRSPDTRDAAAAPVAGVPAVDTGTTAQAFDWNSAGMVGFSVFAAGALVASAAAMNRRRPARLSS